MNSACLEEMKCTNGVNSSHRNKNIPYWNEMAIHVQIITFRGHLKLKKNRRMSKQTYVTKDKVLLW